MLINYYFKLKAYAKLYDKYTGENENKGKYYGLNFAIWNFIEILNLGDFKELFHFFYTRNEGFKKSQKLSYLINPVRLLRNAAAHNNCLLHCIKVPYVKEKDFNYNNVVNAFLGQNGIKNRSLTKNMSKPLLHDFCVMLYLYHKVVPLSSQAATFQRLKDLFDNTISKNKEYYQSNATICSAYEFIYKVICMFLNIVENS